MLKFSYIAMILHDPDRNSMQVQILEAPNPRHIKPGIELPIDDSSGGWVWKNQKPLVCTNVEQDTRFPRAMELIRDEGIRSFCMVPLTTARRRLGALAVGSLHEQPYDAGDLVFLHQVAKQVAVAVENALAFSTLPSSTTSWPKRTSISKTGYGPNNTSGTSSAKVRAETSAQAGHSTRAAVEAPARPPGTGIRAAGKHENARPNSCAAISTIGS